MTYPEGLVWQAPSDADGPYHRHERFGRTVLVHRHVGGDADHTHQAFAMRADFFGWRATDPAGAPIDHTPYSDFADSQFT